MRRHPRSSVLHVGADDGGDGSLIAAAWRLIRCELIGSGVLVGALDLVGLSFCPSLVSVGAGTDDGLSDENHGRYVYQLVELGWFLAPTSSDGLLPLLGVSSSDEPGLMRRQIPCSPAMLWPLAIWLSLDVQQLQSMSVFLMCYTWWH